MHIPHKHAFARRLLLKAGIALLLIMVVAAVALAGATFTVNPPVWNNPGYTWTATVTAMTNPDKQICLTITDAANVVTTTPCTCVGANCNTTGVGTWTCTQSTNVPNGTWDVSSWSAGGGGNCGDEKTTVPSGSGSFGPNAITLSRFQARRGEVASPLLPAAAALGLIMLLGTAVVVRRRL